MRKINSIMLISIKNDSGDNLFKMFFNKNHHYSLLIEMNHRIKVNEP